MRAGSGGAGDGGGATRTCVPAAPPAPSSTAGSRPPSSRAGIVASRPAASTQRDERRVRSHLASSRCATRRATSPRDPTAPEASRSAAGPDMASATRARQRAYARGSPVRSATRSSAASSRSRRIQRPMSQTAGCHPTGTATMRCSRLAQSSRRATCACSWATTWSSSASVSASRSARGTTIIGRRKPRTAAGTGSSSSANCTRLPRFRAFCQSGRRCCAASGSGRARLFMRNSSRRSRVRRARPPTTVSAHRATSPVSSICGAPGSVRVPLPDIGASPPAVRVASGNASSAAGTSGSTSTTPSPSQQSA